MKKVAVSLMFDNYTNNEIFNLNNKIINRDNCAYSFYLLKEKFNNFRVDVATNDINLPLKSNAIICIGLPNSQIEINYEYSYLLLFECEVIQPNSWDKINHGKFRKIFTWNDELVDNKKYYKINFAHKFPGSIAEYHKNDIQFYDKKLCTLISGNKKVNHNLELYSEREKTIRWFENNHPEDFDLYGVGWGEFIINNRYINYLVSKFSFFNGLLAPKFPSYVGSVDSKLITLINYKFAICYENAQMIPGYITEKIFDCFFAGCVPVYWGAPNITDHIPKNCFIDRREFDSHEELYAYLTAMAEPQYLDIQQNIENYLFSENADPYRAETFASIVVEHVLNDLKDKHSNV